MRAAVVSTGLPGLAEATINTIGSDQIRVQTRPLDPTDEVPKVRAAIAQEAGVATSRSPTA